jgi:hypothetical protein
MPRYMNWASREQQCRAILARHPHHAETLADLGDLLTEVGCLTESCAIRLGLARAFPGSQHFNGSAVFQLAMVGRDKEAMARARASLARWPGNGPVSGSAAYGAVYGGMTALAVEMIDQRPDWLPSAAPGLRDAVTGTLDALIGRRQRPEAIRICLDGARQRQSTAIMTVPLLATLGAIDDAFRIMERYFLGRGDFPLPYLYGAKVPGPFENTRKTARTLFFRIAAALRVDPRFLPLVREIGMVDYWRATGSTPDFLHKPG